MKIIKEGCYVVNHQILLSRSTSWATSNCRTISLGSCSFGGSSGRSIVYRIFWGIGALYRLPPSLNLLFIETLFPFSPNTKLAAKQNVVLAAAKITFYACWVVLHKKRFLIVDTFWFKHCFFRLVCGRTDLK